MKNNHSSLLLGLPAYLIGMAVGFFLVVVAAWADMESNFYGFERLANAGLRGFRCPILMTPDETATISFSISNPTENQISPSVKTFISTPLVRQEFTENLQLAPGESKRLEWQVGNENIDLERFIFAKALLYSAHPLPSKETSCGIFIVDLPGSGRVILPVLVILSLLGMGWGLYAMNRLRASYEWLSMHFGSLVFLAAMIILGLVLSFIGGWLLSLIIMVVSLLIMLILLSSWFISERKHRH